MVSVLESLRLQCLIFRSTTWSRKFDKDTKEKKFGSLGHTNITKGAVYKLGNFSLLNKEDTSSEGFKTRNFIDLYLHGKLLYIFTYIKKIENLKRK